MLTELVFTIIFFFFKWMLLVSVVSSILEYYSNCDNRKENVMPLPLYDPKWENHVFAAKVPGFICFLLLIDNLLAGVYCSWILK